MDQAKKILIVEDDVFISDLYAKVFRDAGFGVETVVDGEAALSTISKNTYSAILLDIMIPKLSGIEVLERIKRPTSSARSVPVFVTTNLAQEDIVDRAHQLQADGYLIKSQLTPKQVLQKVVSFLDKKNAAATQS